jgi:hypothetical protein
MGKPYSEDLRARVVVAEQDGATIPENCGAVRRGYQLRGTFSVGSTANGQCQPGQIRRVQRICSGGA